MLASTGLAGTTTVSSLATTSSFPGPPAVGAVASSIGPALSPGGLGLDKPGGLGLDKPGGLGFFPLGFNAVDGLGTGLGAFFGCPPGRLDDTFPCRSGGLGLDKPGGFGFFPLGFDARGTVCICNRIQGNPATFFRRMMLAYIYNINCMLFASSLEGNLSRR